MNLNFQPMTLDMKDPYLALWDKTRQKSSDYSFCVLWCWERDRRYELAFDEGDDLCWIRENNTAPHDLAPIGKWNYPDWPDILRARFKGDVSFELVPEKLVEVWKEQFGDHIEVFENRASWEYLYKVSDLANLKGNKYMRKRNRVNQFSKQVPYTYRVVDEEMLPLIGEFQKKWCSDHHCFSIAGLDAENIGIQRILQDWNRLPSLFGGVLESRGKIIAYTIAEDVGKGTLMIHFEKACLEYNAAYQVINRDFLFHSAQEYKIVNREEDMDDPGLRDAKMSYHPCDFIKKYDVKIRLGDSGATP